MKMQKLLTVVLLGLALTAVSSAFQEDKPKDKTFMPEQSQSIVGQQQSMTGKIAPVGEVGSTGSANPTPSVEGSHDSASFATAEAANSAATFKNAEKAAEAAKHPNSPIGLVIMVVGALVLAAVGFKNYTDKAVPLPKSLS